MKEMLERIKIDVIVSAFACIAFGIVLILWPMEVTTVACKAIGAAIALLGILRLFSYMKGRGEKHGLQLPLGLMLLFVGVWIFLQPHSIQQLLLIGIGVVLFVHGFEDFKYALEVKRGGYDSWAILILLAALCMGFGAACIVNCFGVISLTMGLVGAALIYDGVTDLWIISRMVKTEKAVRRRMEESQAVEAEAKMVSEEVAEAEAEESGTDGHEAHGV